MNRGPDPADPGLGAMANPGLGAAAIYPVLRRSCAAVPSSRPRHDGSRAVVIMIGVTPTIKEALRCHTHHDHRGIPAECKGDLGGKTGGSTIFGVRLRARE